MSPSEDLPDGRVPADSKSDTGARIVRWSDDPGGLPREESARRGIEAVAGFVIAKDIFGTNSYPDAHFCACAEIHHSVTGASVNFDDHIAVNFRVVEIRDGIYPMVGPVSVRMVMQPLSDGNISARWHQIDRSSPGQTSQEGSTILEEIDTRSNVCSPLTLGPIAEPEEGDNTPPAFLILKDPGAGWQIWRRFLRMASDVSPSDMGQLRDEAYNMVYPLFSPEMNWRFRIYDVPGGGIRWEVNSGNRR